jgi:hypothetical protein
VAHVNHPPQAISHRARFARRKDTDMDKRHLGTALEVSAMGLGCMGLSTNYGDPVDTEHGITSSEALTTKG